ncbi:MAG: phage tail protein [Candidatus Arsenophonus phytopathogenicus]
MAKNEILPFGIADGANVLPAEEYEKLTARTNGFNAGVARSQELNTVWRQASMIAHVVAQFIAETNNSDVLDDGNVDKLKAGLISALSKNVNDTVPAATKTVAGITKLSSATNSDDETQAATPKAVKAAYDLAKTVSIDEINKKLDKASVLQTTGDSTDKVLSQKACDDNYAKKNSPEVLRTGNIVIKSGKDYSGLMIERKDGVVCALQTSPNSAFFAYGKGIINIPYNANGTLALTADVDAINNYPVGAPIPWPHATAPDGYFVCRGQTFTTVDYPQLAQAYPSGILPNLCGEFIRGLDLDGHADPDRKVLSNQGDAIRNITGRIGYVRRGWNWPPVGEDGAFRIDKTFNAKVAGGGNDDWGAITSFDPSRVVPTAHENRPRNIAFLYIVRAA